MPNTFTYITSVLVDNSAPTAVNITNIPQTYDDLVVLWTGRENIHNGNLIGKMTFNGALGNTDFKSIWLYAGGSNNVVNGGGDVNTTYNYMAQGMWNANGSTANYYGSTRIYIANYRGTNTNGARTYFADGYGGSNLTGDYSAALIASNGFRDASGNPAITSLYFWSFQGSYSIYQYSNFYLYGINNS